MDMAWAVGISIKKLKEQVHSELTSLNTIKILLKVRF